MRLSERTAFVTDDRRLAAGTLRFRTGRNNQPAGKTARIADTPSCPISALSISVPPISAGRLRNTATTIKPSIVIIMVCLQRSGRVTRDVMAHFTDIKLLMKP